MNKRDLIVIGGGAGGLVVSSVAAQLGLSVTLIEKEVLEITSLTPGAIGDRLSTGMLANLLEQAGKRFRS